MEDGAGIQFFSTRCAWQKVPVVLAFAGLPISFMDGYLRVNYPITVHLGFCKTFLGLRTQMDPRGCDGPKQYFEPRLAP